MNIKYKNEPKFRRGNGKNKYPKSVHLGNPVLNESIRYILTLSRVYLRRIRSDQRIHHVVPLLSPMALMLKTFFA